MSPSRLRDLIALAEEPSSARRRELLREVTDLFFTADNHGEVESELFDEVMSQLAVQMEETVRAELAGRLADSAKAPQGLARRLATDSIAVAAPMLSRSRALSDDDLVYVARSGGQEHLRAISRREGVSEIVSSSIVEHGDDQTLGVLLRNQNARFDRETHEAVVDRAASNPDLHEAVVERRTLPPDLLNEMYFKVGAELRQRILEKNAAVDPAELDAALAVGRRRLADLHGALPADYAQAEAEVSALRRKGQITPQVLASMLRGKQTTKFLCALANMAEIDFATARHILEAKELDALAIACKAAGFDKTLFLTFAVLILDRESNAMGRAREYGELYGRLSEDTALRTIRFWRMRQQVGDAHADRPAETQRMWA